MTDDVTIRPAERNEAAELAVLVDIASQGFAAWLWSGAVLGGATDTAFERGRNKLREDVGPGNWRDAVVADLDDEIAGVSIGYGIDASVAEIEAKHAVLEPLLALQRPVVGHWFIDSLGVYRHRRGRGIGRRLLAHEIARAGSAPVSLITESHNDRAQTLYRANGFEEAARTEAVPLFEGSRKHDWVLFTRKVA
ncbi:acetyltransferase [Ensifer sp. Root142]|uniref:GNAT family N-acetyltransferase n=1 Tax=Ensifer TaxID=106591 RepID=UPI00070AA49E|nr:MULTISPECIES: GNAT family N-acetyltransferase [unclassified Ensifer]KQW75476.1 acetyltransferase [Ensifer sp. Root127]KQY67030.1 acetyltransferase [Ensifer sp. Root142]